MTLQRVVLNESPNTHLTRADVLDFSWSVLHVGFNADGKAEPVIHDRIHEGFENKDASDEYLRTVLDWVVDDMTVARDDDTIDLWSWIVARVSVANGKLKVDRLLVRGDKVPPSVQADIKNNPETWLLDLPVSEQTASRRRARKGVVSAAPIEARAKNIRRKPKSTATAPVAKSTPVKSSAVKAARAKRAAAKK